MRTHALVRSGASSAYSVSFAVFHMGSPQIAGYWTMTSSLCCTGCRELYLVYRLHRYSLYPYIVPLLEGAMEASDNTWQLNIDNNIALFSGADPLHTHMKKERQGEQRVTVDVGRCHSCTDAERGVGSNITLIHV